MKIRDIEETLVKVLASEDQDAERLLSKYLTVRGIADAFAALIDKDGELRKAILTAMGTAATVKTPLAQATVSLSSRTAIAKDALDILQANGLDDVALACTIKTADPALIKRMIETGDIPKNVADLLVSETEISTFRVTPTKAGKEAAMDETILLDLLGLEVE